MTKFRDKTVKVKTLGADRDLVRRLNPCASNETLESMAAIRAVARSVVGETKDTIRALDVLTAEVPKKTLKAWADLRLKKAA